MGKKTRSRDTDSMDKSGSRIAPKENHINWHKAFVAALKLTFVPYKDVLEFQDEVQLNTRVTCHEK
ncbi:MAG: hypothetical protein LBD93_12085 [Treponema sp.]|jgi:hypothetical protein|nr:hypothetical protein [Treponema sp.]